MKFPITSKFNSHESFRENEHLGVDFSMPSDTQLYSIENGVVSKVISEESGSSLGNAIFIKLNDGKELVYAHLNLVEVKVGDMIQKGQEIGLSGNTGRVIGENGGYHLHLGLRNENGDWINPEQYIPHIQIMSEGITKFSDNMIKLDASDMLNKALDIFTDTTINLISWIL